MCLRVEKVLVACSVGPSSVMRNFAFRITEGSKLELACSISVDAPFFNTQVRDVTLGEDGNHMRTGQAPQVLAALRNGLIGL